MIDWYPLCDATMTSRLTVELSLNLDCVLPVPQTLATFICDIFVHLTKYG